MICGEKSHIKLPTSTTVLNIPEGWATIHWVQLRKRREQMGEEERDRRRERLRRRRERAAITSGRVYLKPMTRVCQHCKALRFPSEPLNFCHSGKISLPPLGDYPSPLKDLFTGSNPILQSLATSRTTLPTRHNNRRHTTHPRYKLMFSPDWAWTIIHLKAP